MVASASNEQLEDLPVAHREGGLAGLMRRRWWLAALVPCIAGLAALPIIRNTAQERGAGVECPMASPDNSGPRWIGDRSSVSLTSLSAENLQKSRDPVRLSDLAAAYLIRAKEEHEPGAFVRALDAATRAVSLDPSLKEAQFNRSLALDRLGLHYEAESAWTHYLQTDSGSTWSKLARAQRDELRKPSEPDLWRLQLPELRTAADRGDAIRVRQIVKSFPQLARELALEEVLGQWGDQFLAQDAADAKQSAEMALALGAALREVNGDRSVETVAAVVARAQESPSEFWAAGLARGHRAFREGMAAFRRLATEEAGLRFAEAVKESARSGSPIGLWATAGRARVEAYDGDHASARKDFESVLADARRLSFTSLVGWCEWGLGWVESRQGDFLQATRRFLLAEEAYRQTRDIENLAAIASFLGENLASLGQGDEAWRHRRLALVTLRRHPVSLRRHVALMDSSWSAMKEGLGAAGLAFQDEALQAAAVVEDPVRLAETNWARSRILVELGRSEDARQALQQASQYTRLAPPGSPRKRLEADLAWARGDILRRLGSGAALADLTSAIQSYEALKVPLNFAYASYSRAQLLLNMGNSLEAEEDLSRSLRTLEELVTELDEDDLRISYSESIQDIYDDLIRYRWTWNRDPLAALSALERARGLGAAAEDEWVRIKENIDPGTVVIEYGLLEDRLLIWTIGADGIQSMERIVERSRLEGLVESFREEILRGDRPDRLEAISSALYDLLIPPSVDIGCMLYLIPDQVLNQVPFAALYNRRTRRFLVQDHAIAWVPSLSYLRFQENDQQQTKAPSSVLLVADPVINHSLFPSLSSLRGARAEMEAVKALFPSATLLERDEATKDRLLAELERAEVFVFSGHAFSHASRPSRSHLVVSPSSKTGDPGMLLAGDLVRRSFGKLRVVVLSACTSVGPRSARSSGITGLARPFLLSGAESVVGSLWAVEDRRTRDFMREFYRVLAHGGPADKALRQAQLQAVSHSESAWQEISVWASFVCVDSTKVTR